MIKLLKKHWFIIFLLISALFLRFFKLSDFYFFNIDEDWSNFIIRKIAVLHKPVLIGWDIPGGFYVPPVMYYYGSILMLIFKNNPLGFAINASVISILSVILVYFVGKEIFHSKKIAIFASVIYCFSYFVNIYSRLTVNLYLVPFLSLLTYYSLSQIIINNRKKWLYLTAIILIFATQEGSTLSLIILVIVSLICFRPKIRFKNTVLPILIFLSSFISLLIFDFRHDFQISKRYLAVGGNFTSGISKNVQIIPAFTSLFTTFTRYIIPTGPNDLNVQILPCKKYFSLVSKATPKIFPILGLLLTSLFLFIPAKDKKIIFGKKLISIHLGIIMLGLILYSYLGIGYLYEWFFVMFTPAFSFIIGYLLSIIDKPGLRKTTVYLSVIIIALYNLKYFITGTNTISYQDKLAAAEYAKNILKGKSFELTVIGDGCNKYGYRYLFTYLNNEPVKSYLDYQYLDWLYKQSPPQNISAKVIIVPRVDIVTDEQKNEYNKYKSQSVYLKSFGNLEVLITE